jgi:phosphoglucosamine mutase
LGLHKAIEKLGATVDVTAVGDRYVLESMLKTGCAIGGEQSGHVIFLNHATTGDGILAALQLVKAVKMSGEKISTLSDRIETFPQVLKNAKVKNENKSKFADDPEIKVEIERVEKIMSGEGRVLIRPSGTEPKVRVMIEGKDLDVITELAENLANMLTEKFG